MKKLLKSLSANNIKGNASYRFRIKRMNIFSDLLKKWTNNKNEKLLDIGGVNYFWEQFVSFIPENIKLFLLNIDKNALKGYSAIVGDANNLSFIKDKSFDYVLSNSLIEHLGAFESQKKFATEIQRISKHFFVQTPAFIFPLEPHFLFPFFHWLPFTVRKYLHLHFSLGWFDKARNNIEAEKLIKEIRILKKYELKKIFPNAKIITEYWGIFPKSYIIISE